MPPEQINEQELQFKKRARRRLVGAVALVLLMVTILPMILDDRSAKNAAPEIEISIPSQDSEEDSKAFTSKVVAAQPAETTQAPLNNDVEPTQSNPSKPDEIKQPAVTEEVINKTEPEKIVDKKAVVKPAVVEKPQAPEKSNASGEFMVQIGVFSNEDNVKQLQQKLKDKGFRTSTEKIQTPKGEKIRLRAGPFADRAIAEQALSNITSAGLTGMIVSN